MATKWLFGDVIIEDGGDGTFWASGDLPSPTAIGQWQEIVSDTGTLYLSGLIAEDAARELVELEALFNLPSLEGSDKQSDSPVSGTPFWLRNAVLSSPGPDDRKVRHPLAELFSRFLRWFQIRR